MAALRRHRQRSATSTRRVLRAFRLLVAVMLAIFLSQSTLAFAFPCFGRDCAASDGRDGSDGRDRRDGCDGCDHDEQEQDQDQDQGDDHERCPCPIDCGAACAGSALRAIPPAFELLILPSPLSSAMVWLRQERSPPSTEPGDIRHVPRHRA